MQRLRPTTFCETVVDMGAKTLGNTKYYSLLKVEAQTPIDTLRDMDSKASANTLANKVAEVKADKVGETLMDAIGALSV